jgi:hypothetical protein
MCPPDDRTIDLNPLSFRDLEISITPLSTPPVFKAGKI